MKVYKTTEVVDCSTYFISGVSIRKNEPDKVVWTTFSTNLNLTEDLIIREGIAELSARHDVPRDSIIVISFNRTK